jgi:hypothetical protein
LKPLPHKAKLSTSKAVCHVISAQKAWPQASPQKHGKNFSLFKTEPSNTLAQIHLDAGEAKSSWAYFEGDAYKKESKHLKDFLQKYSLDRGRHNSCY